MQEFEAFFKFVPAASLASIAEMLVDGVTIDCGSDIAPAVSSPDTPWYYGFCGGLGGVLSRCEREEERGRPKFLSRLR